MALFSLKTITMRDWDKKHACTLPKDLNEPFIHNFILTYLLCQQIADTDCGLLGRISSKGV